MKVDFDIIFRLNAAQKLIAEHCVSDFYVIFHLKAAEHLLQSTIWKKFRHDFPPNGGSEIGCRALWKILT